MKRIRPIFQPVTSIIRQSWNDSISQNQNKILKCRYSSINAFSIPMTKHNCSKWSSNHTSDSWLFSTKKYHRWFTSTASKSSTTVPVSISNYQLRRVFIASAAPMLGFGFMDNFIMIQAGGAIDATLGVKFGLATMTAAAMGQVVSDVSGVLFGGFVKRLLHNFGISVPTLSTSQRTLSSYRFVSMSGAVIGVAVGCLLGAFPLLLNDKNTSERQRRMDEVRATLNTMIHISANSGDEGNVSSMIGAQHAAIHLCEDRDGHLKFSMLKSSCYSDASTKVVINCSTKKQIIRKSFIPDEQPTIMCKLMIITLEFFRKYSSAIKIPFVIFRRQFFRCSSIFQRKQRPYCSSRICRKV